QLGLKTISTTLNNPLIDIDYKSNDFFLLTKDKEYFLASNKDDYSNIVNNQDIYVNLRHLNVYPSDLDYKTILNQVWLLFRSNLGKYDSTFNDIKNIEISQPIVDKTLGLVTIEDATIKTSKKIYGSQEKETIVLLPGSQKLVFELKPFSNYYNGQMKKSYKEDEIFNLSNIDSEEETILLLKDFFKTNNKGLYETFLTKFMGRDFQPSSYSDMDKSEFQLSYSWKKNLKKDITITFELKCLSTKQSFLIEFLINDFWNLIDGSNGSTIILPENSVVPPIDIETKDAFSTNSILWISLISIGSIGVSGLVVWLILRNKKFNKK
ncbi:MAG: hypothetical protein ACRC4M_05250, partial [Mycoplasma sp.]